MISEHRITRNAGYSVQERIRVDDGSALAALTAVTRVAWTPICVRRIDPEGRLPHEKNIVR